MIWLRMTCLLVLAMLALPVNGYIRIATAGPQVVEQAVALPDTAPVVRAIDAGLPKGMLRLYSCMPDIALPGLQAQLEPALHGVAFAVAAGRTTEEWLATPPHGPPRPV